VPSSAETYHVHTKQKKWKCLVDSFLVDELFVRFDLYASHVRSLDIYDPDHEYFKVTGWGVGIVLG
jgi:hypothetical protein